MKSKIFNILKIVISVAMLSYILLTINLKDLGAAVLKVRWGYLILAALLALGGVALRALRWLALLHALKINAPLKRLVRLYFVGTFFNIFLLSGFGGDAIRMMELTRYSKKAPEAIGTVLVDRATGLWVLFVLGLIALPFAASSISPEITALLALLSTAVIIGGWVAMGTKFIPWLGTRVKLPAQAKLERFYRAVSGCGYAALGQACAVSLLFNLMNTAVRFLIACGLNVNLPLGVFFAFAPILSMSLMLPSIGGLGVREWAHTLVYGTVNISETMATAMSLATFVLQMIIPGAIGAVLYALEGAKELQNQES